MKDLRLSNELGAKQLARESAERLIKIETIVNLFGFLCVLFFMPTVFASDYESQKHFSLYRTPNSLLISNKTKSFEAYLNGYFMLDAFKIPATIPQLDSGYNVPFAQLCLDGTALHSWDYSLRYDFSSMDLKEAYVSYTGWQDKYLKAGQFQPDISLSNWAEDTQTDFLDLSLPVDLFVPGYSRGLEIGINNSQFIFHTSIYSAGTQDYVSGRMPLGMAARLIYSPIHTDTRAIDLGLSAWGSWPDSKKTTNYSEDPEIETHKEGAILNTGSITNIVNTWNGGLEAAYVYGPWNIQTEYLRTLVRRNIDKNLQFDGYHILGSYFLTGESMKYDFPGGGFAGISTINNKRLGAWQILARLSYLNLNDKDISGGKETNATLGLNWYVNQFIMFKANYIRVMAQAPKSGNNTTGNIFALRLQLQF